MSTLPLYPSRPRAEVEYATPRSLSASCRACSFGELARGPSGRVCAMPDGRMHTGRGGVYVLASHLQRQEGPGTAPFSVGVQALIRREILGTKRPDGTPPNVVFDWAVRCVPRRPRADVKGDKAKAKRELEAAHAACRPHTTEILMQLAPSRVLAFGDDAARVLFGSDVPWTRNLTRAVGWLGSKPAVPVFLFADPVEALAIPSLRQRYLGDVRWALTTERPSGGPPPWDGTYTVVETLEEARAADAACRAARRTSFDLETNGAPLWTPELRITTVSLAPAAPDGDYRHAFVFPAEVLAEGDPRGAILRALLKDPAVEKTGTNLKFDLNVTGHCLGIEVRGVTFDTLLAARLIEPEAAADLDTTGWLVGCGGHKSEAREALATAKKRLDKQVKAEKKAPGQAWLFPEEKLTIPEGSTTTSAAYGYLGASVRDRYAARDTIASGRLSTELERRLDGLPHQRRLWHNVIRHATEPFHRIEARGFPIDRDRLFAVADVFSERIHVEREAIAEVAPGLNPDSSAQVADYLYNRLGLTPPKLTEGGQGATDREALTYLADEHPVAARIAAYSELVHFRGIYLDGTPEPGKRYGTTGMLRFIHPDPQGITGWRVCTSYRLTGAVTGRLSSSEPNLQNIPRAETDLGALIKGMFIAPPGWKILQVDYSQLELRIAALLSKDPKMAEIFRSGVDYHLRTAELVCDPAVWAKLDKDARKARRSRAKAVNFGLLYGMREKTLAKRMGPGTTVAEARETMNAILGELSVLAAWIAERIAAANATGEIWTEWLGERARCRPVHYMDFRNNVAVNTPVQGTASELCFASVIEAENAIHAEAMRAQLIGTIHDSILALVPDEELHETAAILRQVMEGWLPDSPVPITVDADYGQDWAHLSALDLAA